MTGCFPQLSFVGRDNKSKNKVVTSIFLGESKGQLENWYYLAS